MRPNAIKKLLLKVYRTSRKSVLLLGPPGIGKSTVVREVAMELARSMGKEFIDYNDTVGHKILENPKKYFIFHDLRLTEVEPSDLIGIPRDVDESVVYKPLLWAKVLNVADGILFLDEITNVERDDVKAISYKLLLDRKAGYIPFGKGVMVVAAGNRPEESSIARPLAAPQMNRVIKVDVDAPTVDEWAEWMEKNKPNYCKEILAYLMMFKEDLLKLPKDPEVLENFPTPRSWTHLAETLTDDYRDIYTPDEMYELAKGSVGVEVAPKVQKFLTSRIPSINELIERPEIFASLNIEGKYVATVVLGRWLQEHKRSIGKARKLIETIADVSEELIVLLIKSIIKGRYEITMEMYKMSDKVREVMDKLSDLMLKYEE